MALRSIIPELIGEFVMSVGLALGLLAPVVYLLAAVGVVWMLRKERRSPSAYTRSPEYLAAVEHRSVEPKAPGDDLSQP